MRGPATRDSFRRWLWLGAAVLVLAALAAAFTWWRPRHASAQVRSLAVLPSAGAGPQWLSDGLTQEIIDALARFPALRVTAPASAFQFPQQPRDLRAIGAQLGVQAVLETSIAAAGDTVAVTARMTRAADGYKLWTEVFRAPRQDAFLLPTKVAAAVAGRVHVAGQAVSLRRNPSPAALDAYLEGRALLNRSDSDSCSHAEERFTEATRADPEFAPAWAWLSMAIECRVDDGLDRPNAAMPAARDAAERAVALDPNAAATHLALGIVRLQYDWDWAGAKQELDRAFQLSPGSALILRWRARWCETQGRIEEAREDTARAQALDPLTAPDPPVSPFAAAESAARRGDDTEAHRILDQAEDLRAASYIPAAAFSSLAAADQDWDACFQWLEVEYDERSVHLPYARMIPGIPQADPRFTDLLQRMNLPLAADR